MTLNEPLRATTIAAPGLIVTTVLAVLLGIAAAGDGVLPGDVGLTRALQRLDGPIVSGLADVGNAAGSTVGALAILTVVVIVLARRQAWQDLFFVTTLLALRLLATQLKPLFASPRPTADLVQVQGTFDGLGYPSGHAVTGMVMGLALSIVAWRRARDRRVAMALTVAFCLLTLVIGLARIWSGAHWPSDVLGGYLFGAAIVALAVLIRDRQPWFTR